MIVAADPRADPRALPGRGGLRRARRRAPLLRGLRIGRTDGPAAADVGAHPLATLEDADPVLGPARPCRHVRRAWERPLRPPAGRRGIRDPRVRGRHARGDGRDGDGTRCHRRLVVRGALGLMLAAEHPERVAGAAFIGPAVPLAPPLPERPSMPLTSGSTPTKGWAKYNMHHWLRDYRGLPRVLHREDASRSRTRRSRSRTPSAGRSRRPREVIADHDAGIDCRSAATSGARGRVRCPVLVLHGDKDALALAYARRGARRGDGRAARHARRRRTRSARAGSRS